MNRISRLCCAFWLTASALPAMAHPFHGASGGLATGFAHPFLGLDHLLAMVAVGVWAVQQGGTAVWRLPVAFCTAMAVGVALGFAGVAVPLTEPFIAASVLVLGLAILSARRVALAYAVPLVAFFALFHGISHGMEQALALSSWWSLAGLLSATVLLHLAGVASGAALLSRVRVAGAPLIVTGVWLLSRALA
jgi:urease accessory protein